MALWARFTWKNHQKHGQKEGLQSFVMGKTKVYTVPLKVYDYTHIYIYTKWSFLGSPRSHIIKFKNISFIRVYRVDQWNGHWKSPLANHVNHIFIPAPSNWHPLEGPGMCRNITFFEASLHRQKGITTKPNNKGCARTCGLLGFNASATQLNGGKKGQTFFETNKNQIISLLFLVSLFF